MVSRGNVRWLDCASLICESLGLLLNNIIIRSLRVVIFPWGVIIPHLVIVITFRVDYFLYTHLINLSEVS